MNKPEPVLALLDIRNMVCTGGAKLTGGLLSHQSCACEGCRAVRMAFELGQSIRVEVERKEAADAQGG